MLSPRPLYSQSDEETIIVDYFKEYKGNFLDLGAWDGKTFSNTRRLAELGWAGTMVEADPHSFCNLMQNIESFPFVTPVHAFVTAKPGTFRFHSSQGDGVSTCDEFQKQKWERSGTRFQSFFMPATPIRDLLRAVGSEFAFISIDIEGISVEVLEEISLLETKMVCVEYDKDWGRAADYCMRFGLKERLLLNAENIIMARPK